MKRLFFFIIALSIAVFVTSQQRNIARGAEPGEFYITCNWYGIYGAWGPPFYDTLSTAVFRITENGKKLTIQYDIDNFDNSIYVMYPYYILADATPGVVYMSVHYSKNWYEHTALWVSFDYGKNWAFREENIGAHYYYPANFEGLIYRGGGSSKVAITPIHGIFFMKKTIPILLNHILKNSNYLEYLEVTQQTHGLCITLMTVLIPLH